MKRLCGLLLALVALQAWGAVVSIDGPRNPDGTLPLCGTFRVLVSGAPGASGQTTLVVLRTGEVLQVPLVQDGDQLRTAPIQLRRPCDPPAALALEVELGDTIVAATELADGGCSVARVGPRLRASGEPSLSLLRLDNDAMEWVDAEIVEPGLFTVILQDASLDTTCRRETVDVLMGFKTESVSLRLTEEEPVGGRFIRKLVMQIQPIEDTPALELRILDEEKNALLKHAVVEGDVLSFTWEELTLRIPVRLLSVGLAPADLVLPVGCTAEVRVVAPERLDEVRWFVNGVRQAADGRSLPLCPDAPRTLNVVALVRYGLQWGLQGTTVTIVPQTRVSFVAADTGLPVDEPWRCSVPLQVKVEHVRGELHAIVVGRLGPDPRPCEIPVGRVGDGVWLSVPFRPTDLGICGGDVLWAQFVDPRGCYTSYVVLPLR